MYISHAFLSTLPLFSCALTATAASLRERSLSGSNDLLLSSSGDVNESLAVPVATPVPFTYRNVFFNFTLFDQLIPKTEIENVLTSADQAITDLVDHSPFEPITNDRFEHRAPGGNTLISIQANAGKTVTWTQLFRLLQGLYRFMVGTRVQQQHCQALDFSIAFGGQEKVAFGVVRYFPPDVDQTRKRSTMSAPSILVNQTALNLPNGNNSSNAQPSNANPMRWPIPETSLELDFYFFGIPIPEEKVTRTLRGALARVRPFSTSVYKDDGITGEAFDWALPPNGDGTKTGFTVLAYISHDVTWEQLSQVLNGLHQFTTGNGTNLGQHFQVLGFRIINAHEGKIGVGTLSYYPRRLTEVEKRGSIASQDSLQPINITSATLATAESECPVSWPVLDTSIVLDFILLGQEIPLEEMLWTLANAQENIANNVREQPSAFIKEGSLHFSSKGSGIYANIIITRSSSTSWLELSQILFGLMRFCELKDSRVFVFDIDISGVRVGFGTILYGRPSVSNTLVKRVDNGTVTLPNFFAGSKSISYNIPNTKDYLEFNSFGKAVPSSDIIHALGGALSDIWEFVHGIPNSPIPRNRYRYDHEEGVFITITPSTFIKMTWSQLDEVLTGLMCFVTGVNPRRGGNLKTNYQVLGFGMITYGEGYIGTGILGYNPPSPVEIAKRAAVDTLGRYIISERTSTAASISASDLTLLQQLNDTINHPSAAPASNIHLQVPAPLNQSPNASTLALSQEDIRFPIINTDMTLVFTKLGNIRIPIDTVSELFTSATEAIAASITSTPSSTIPGPLWYYKIGSVRGASLLISIYTRNDHKVSWGQLSKILSGLELFMMAQRRSLNFDIDVEGEEEVGKGVVWYSPPRPLGVDTAAAEQ